MLQNQSVSHRQSATRLDLNLRNRLDLVATESTGPQMGHTATHELGEFGLLCSGTDWHNTMLGSTWNGTISTLINTIQLGD